MTRYLASRGFTVLLEELAPGRTACASLPSCPATRAWLERGRHVRLHGRRAARSRRPLDGLSRAEPRALPDRRRSSAARAAAARAASCGRATSRLTASTWITSPAPATRTWAALDASSRARDAASQAGRIRRRSRAWNASCSALEARPRERRADPHRAVAARRLPLHRAGQGRAARSSRSGRAWRFAVGHAHSRWTTSCRVIPGRHALSPCSRHDLHLARRPTRGPGQRRRRSGGGEVDSIGTHLAKRHGRGLRGSGCSTRGRDSQPFAAPGDRSARARALLGLAERRARARAGGRRSLVPVRGPLGGPDTGQRSCTGAPPTSDLGAQADALYFSRRVSPLQS